MRYLFLALFAVVFSVGCRSTTTIYEFSDDGKILRKKIVTDESALKSVMMEMEKKNVAWGTNGWVFQGEVTCVSQDTYFPTVKIRAANGNHWHISLLPYVDVPSVIKNIMLYGSDLKVDARSIKIGGGNSE